MEAREWAETTSLSVSLQTCQTGSLPKIDDYEIDFYRMYISILTITELAYIPQQRVLHLWLSTKNVHILTKRNLIQLLMWIRPIQ